MQTGGKYTHADLEKIQNIFFKYQIDTGTVIVGQGANYKKNVLTKIHPDKNKKSSKAAAAATNDFTYAVSFPEYAEQYYMQGRAKLTVQDVLNMTPRSSEKVDPEVKKKMEDIQEDLLNFSMTDSKCAGLVIDFFISLLVYITFSLLGDKNKKVRQILSAKSIAFIIQVMEILENIKRFITKKSPGQTSSKRSTSKTKTKRVKGGRKTMYSKSKYNKNKTRKTKARKTRRRRRIIGGGTRGIVLKQCQAMDVDDEDDVVFILNARDEIEIIEEHPMAAPEKYFKVKNRAGKFGIIPESCFKETIGVGYGYDQEYPEMEGDIDQFIDQLIAPRGENNPKTLEFETLLYKYLSEEFITKDQILEAMSLEESTLKTMQEHATKSGEPIALNADMSQALDSMVTILNASGKRHITKEDILANKKELASHLNACIRLVVRRESRKWGDLTRQWKKNESPARSKLETHYKVEENKNQAMTYFAKTIVSGGTLFLQALNTPDPLRGYTERYSAEQLRMFPNPPPGFSNPIVPKWTLNEFPIANIWPIIQFSILFAAAGSVVHKTEKYQAFGVPLLFLTGAGLLTLAAFAGGSRVYFRAACGIGQEQFCREPIPYGAVEYNEWKRVPREGAWSSWGMGEPDWPTLDSWIGLGPNIVYWLWNTVGLQIGELIKDFIIDNGDNVIFLIGSLMLIHSMYMAYSRFQGYRRGKKLAREDLRIQMEEAAGFKLSGVEKIDTERGPPGGLAIEPKKDAVRMLFSTANEIRREQQEQMQSLTSIYTLQIRNDANVIARELNEITRTGVGPAQERILTAEEQAERQDYEADELGLQFPDAPETTTSRLITVAPEDEALAARLYKSRQPNISVQEEAEAEAEAPTQAAASTSKKTKNITKNKKTPLVA